MSAELLRSLAVLAEPPTPETAHVGEVLGLGPPPPPAEHADLFAFNVYPYASVYLGPEGKLGGDAKARIGGFWSALGIEAPSEPDHFASLLGLLAGIKERASGEADESQRLLLEEAAAACLFEHIVPWASNFLRAVGSHGSEFYSRWATMVYRVLGAETTRYELGALQRLPVHLATAEEIRTPAEIGGSEFLEHLLAPIRTGIVMSRQDMARLGRDVGLGARIGERRYMLEAYLGQDPHGTLQWLATHAGTWVTREDEPLSRLRRFWVERATNTVRVLHEATDQARHFVPGAPPSDSPEPGSQG